MPTLPSRRGVSLFERPLPAKSIALRRGLPGPGAGRLLTYLQRPKDFYEAFTSRSTRFSTPSTSIPGARQGVLCTLEQRPTALAREHPNIWGMLKRRGIPIFEKGPRLKERSHTPLMSRKVRRWEEHGNCGVNVLIMAVPVLGSSRTPLP